MESWNSLITSFIKQANTKDLKTSYYQKEWLDLTLRISFGMGTQARIPWIALIAPDMAVSKGYYPVYLYYKDYQVLILSYGVSETEEFGKSWPIEVINSCSTINAFFDKEVPRYGDSFVFKAYKVEKDLSLTEYNSKNALSEKDIDSDLLTICDYYKKTFQNVTTEAIVPEISHGIFYMEKQLEDFIVHNWEKTELGKKYDLIIEDGELISQQFRTGVGPIDILARKKSDGSHVVIELKKNQTSDDTVGQLARYMGWIKKNKKDDKVSGVIIAGQEDSKLLYALSMVPNSELFLYKVDFKLAEVKSVL